MVEIKCKKCRKILFENTQSMLLNAHSLPISQEEDMCESITQAYNLYIDEECLPIWVKTSIEKGEWSKGKILCPHCNTRIGGFDFISGMKCSCSSSVLPSVHIIKSKVDLPGGTAK